MSPRPGAQDSRLQYQPNAARAAEDGSEQQLVEACELMLLQRCFRELLLEEFVTTLHMVCTLLCDSCCVGCRPHSCRQTTCMHVKVAIQ